MKVDFSQLGEVLNFMKKILLIIFVLLVICGSVIIVSSFNKQKSSDIQESIKIIETEPQKFLDETWRRSNWILNENMSQTDFDKIKKIADEFFSKYQDERAADILGKIYYKGLGNIAPDHNKAEFYFTHSFIKSFETNVFLGFIYYKGDFGIQKDIKKAIEHLKYTGHDCANLALGNIYWEGNGVKKDPQKAFTNWREAFPVGYMYNDRCPNLIYDAYMEEYEKYKKNLKQAVDQDYAEAQYLLAQQYKRDIISLYYKAAEKGHKEAKFNLADSYLKLPYYIHRDYFNDAFKLFEELYNNNKNPFKCSSVALGNMYYTGKGTEKNVKKAMELWKEDSCYDTSDPYNEHPYIDYSTDAFNYLFEYLNSTNQAEAMYQEGENCCSHAHKVDYGSDIMDNYEQRFKWFKSAAEKGHTKAQVRLAEIYLYGDRYNPIGYYPKEAKKWLLKAAEKGDAEAKTLLKKIILKK